MCALVCAIAGTLSATQFSYSDSGGTVSLSPSNLLTISDATLASPSGTVTMSCPLTYQTPQYPFTEEWTCAGGSLSAQSSDGSTTIAGTFTSGLFTLQEVTQRGVTYYNYVFSADFSGSQAKNGKSAAMIGAVSEALASLDTFLDPATGTIQTGLIDLSQQYEPVYIADTGNNRIVESADMVGSNWVGFGKAGAGVNQFSQPWGIAVDSANRLYISDSGNCRIVRIDKINGANWTSYGTCGSGSGQFSSPKGLHVDAKGKIYVADSGNNRIVRMDDMTGTNFTTLGSLGSGRNQFNNPTGVTTDSAENIYVADAANARIVEFADMGGTNWATLQFSVGYTAPGDVALDSADRIYLTDSLQNQVIRADNIGGAHTVSLNVDSNNPVYNILAPTGIFVDPDGALYVADSGNYRALRFFDFSFNDVFSLGTAGSGLGNLSQAHGVVVIPVTKPIAVAAVVPTSLAFPTELVGTASPSETAVLTNIGTKPFRVASVTSSSADFLETNNCPATLAGGQNCSAFVYFQPTTGGQRKGNLTFSLKHASSISVPLSGSGALVTVSPTLLILYENASGTVTVTNPLNSATSIQSVQTTGVFTQTNNCGPLAPGQSCQIVISWTGQPPQYGTLTVVDSSGTPQYVDLVGE